MKRGLMIGLLCLSLTACSFGVGAGGGSNGVGIGVGTGVRFYFLNQSVKLKALLIAMLLTFKGLSIHH